MKKLEEALLEPFAAATARRDMRRGGVDVLRLRRWRGQLDATLQRGVSAALIAAHEGLPGHAHNRHAAHE